MLQRKNVCNKRKAVFWRHGFAITILHVEEAPNKHLRSLKRTSIYSLRTFIVKFLMHSEMYRSRVYTSKIILVNILHILHTTLLPWWVIFLHFRNLEINNTEFDRTYFPEYWLALHSTEILVSENRWKNNGQHSNCINYKGTTIIKCEQMYWKATME